MTASADWYADPAGRHQVRYWDGTDWTDHVADAGVSATEPLETAAPAPTAPVPHSNPPAGGWMDKAKALAQDVVDDGKVLIDEVSAPPKSTTPTQQVPDPATGPTPPAVQRTQPVSRGATLGSAAASTTPSPQSPAQRGMTDQLRDLAKLRDEGILTEEEFLHQKTKLLGS